MEEPATDDTRSTTLPNTIAPHRQLLLNLDGNVDSASDKEGTTDDDVDLLDVPLEREGIDSLLAVSISQAQTHMKSPRTPATEKAQALKESREYFEVEPIGEDGGQTPQSGSPGEDASGPLASPWKSQLEQNRRSSVARAFLGASQSEARKRSSSGPTAILEGLRKMFNDFSPYQSTNLNNKQDDQQHASTSTQPHAPDVEKMPDDRPQSLAYPRLNPIPGPGLDGATTSSEHRNSRPTALRRVTSDNSLYLRRAITGASDFDDTTVYSKVADMPNSRFKAITDSLADSSIKLPRMPNINFNSPRNSPSRTNSETTQRNTAFNSGAQSKLRLVENSTLPTDHGIGPAPATSKKHPMLADALTCATGDVVFMGGYRGSVLRLAQPPYHQLWVPVKVGLNLRKADLEVGLSHEDEERMEEKIVPSGILSHIGPIDIARRLLKKVRKCHNARTNLLRVHDWGYDWRLSPHFLSRKLIKFLEGLECNHPETPPEKRGALIIAHSLGGLITRHAVNQRPELFSGVIYAGAPQNCCNILGPLRNGDDVLLSSKVLTAQVNFTLRTSYALLPENGRCFLNKDTGERYDIDFFDINSWDEYRLSPCIKPAISPTARVQQRKSIVGSITESISSFAPSLPSKRSSWFSTSNATAPSPDASTDTLKDTVEETKEDIESTAQAAGQHIQSPKQEIQDSLEPSMKSSPSKSSVATAVTIPRDKAREYLARTLAEVKQFKTELNHIPEHQDANRYPPHAIIFGKSVPTVYGAKVASREAIKDTDAYNELAFASGDGVVLASAAQLPQGYRCVKGGRVESDRGHIGLLGDLEGIGRCISAVIEGRRRGIGMGRDTL